MKYRQSKFFIGALFDGIGGQGIKYFAPVSSHIKSNDAEFLILGRKDRVTASKKMNFMFPVVDGVYEKLDFKSLQPQPYKDLVMRQYAFCNKHRSSICNLAENIYAIRRSGKHLTPEGAYIINFAKLEKRASQYRKNKTGKSLYGFDTKDLNEGNTNRLVEALDQLDRVNKKQLSTKARCNPKPNQAPKNIKNPHHKLPRKLHIKRHEGSTTRIQNS